MKIKKKYLLFSLFAAAFAIAGLWKFYEVYAATDGDYYFFYENSLSEGAAIELKNTTGQLIVKHKAGIEDITDPNVITWTSSDENVVSVSTPDTTKPMIATLTRNGPGYAKITAVITQHGVTYTLTCMVKVDFKIYKGALPFKKIFTTDLEENYPMVLNDEIGTEIDYALLRYSDESQVASSMVWESKDNSVVSIDKDNKKIVIKGAGVTEIEVRTDTTRQEQAIAKTFRVIVEPKARNPQDADTSYPFRNRFSITQNNFKPSLEIETNAADAAKLVWVIYDEKFEVIPAGRVTYNTEKNSFYINSAKAGTYFIRGYVSEEYIPSNLGEGNGFNVDFIQIKLTVPIAVDNTTDESEVVMNVGDTYSIVDNSNIPSAGIFGYKTLNSSVATVNNGVITAKGVGNTVIELTLIGSDPDDPVTYKIKIKVIDGIALNYSSINIYTAGTVLLEAYVTNRTIPVVWTSDKPGVASVVDGLVTGLSEGGPVTITASQTINGVVKSATCIVNVQQSVNKITIDPAEVSLNISEKATLSATIEPAGLNNVSLKWMSSNESIVKVENAYDLSATIQGLAGGTAVITAINEENVVVGYCRVTVKEKVTGITLSQTSVTTSLATKTYQLSATVSPSTATNKKINWSTTNSKVATVDSNGLVTLVSGGTASIIATSDDNPAVTAICNITVEISAASLKLDETSKVLYVGDSYRLGYTVTPTNAANKDIKWSSSSTSVVSVDSSGLLKATGVGQAIITAKTADGTLSATCTITVKQKAEGISLDVTDLELYVNQEYELEVTVTPAGSNDYTLTWESSNTSVATVDEKGKITAVGEGKTTITVKTSTGKVAYCNVTVKEQVSGIQLNYNEKNIVIGEEFTIKATIVPSSAADQVRVTWSSSKTSVATVSSSGVVKGLKGGTAIITCKTDDGKFTAFCVVTVVERVTSVTLNKSNIPVGLGKTYTLKATIKSNAATKPTVKWTSSNTRIATVDSKGKITGKAIGTVTITAAAQDGSNAKDTCTVRVVRQATSLSLNKTSVTTVEGRTFKLTATVKPSNASYKTANWTSSDEKVAIVDSSGNVTALSEGNVTIKATAKDNSGKTATCFVIVQPRTPANSVTIINQNLTMVVGETTTIQKAINPTTSTDRFTWETDNKTVASVDSTTGKVIARTPGIANVTVMTESGKTASTKITVVGLNTSDLVLEQYSTYRLSVIGITGGVTWDVDDNEIAVVANGLVSSRRIGTTTITATVNGRRLACRLKVVKIK